MCVLSAVPRFFESEFGEDVKVATQDAPHQIVRFVVNNRLRPMLWRAVHPFVLSHDVDLTDITTESGEATGTLVVTGYLRSRAVKVGQLARVADVGVFPIAR